MKKSTFLPILLTLALGLSGCSAKPVAGTCMLYAGMACMTFSGKTYIDNPDATLSACAGLPAEQKPEFSKNPCPTKEMIGICTHFALTPNEIATRYYPGRTNMPEQIAAAARETCTKTNGVWKDVTYKKTDAAQLREPAIKKDGHSTSDQKPAIKAETAGSKADSKKIK